MNAIGLKKLCEEANPLSQVVLKVADDRNTVGISAWVTDDGFLVIEELKSVGLGDKE